MKIVRSCVFCRPSISGKSVLSRRNPNTWLAQRRGCLTWQPAGHTGCVGGSASPAHTGRPTEVFGCAGRREHEGNPKEMLFYMKEIPKQRCFGKVRSPGCREEPEPQEQTRFGPFLLPPVGLLGDAAWLPHVLGHLLFLDSCCALTIEMKYPLNETK